MCGVNFSGGGSAFVNEKDKTLYIKGTDKRDEIDITQAKDFIRVRINKEFHDIPAYDVEKVDVKALDGNDIIRFEDKRKGTSLNHLPLDIDCGDGNDTVYAGEGDDLIHGGKGDDEIYGEGGTNILEGGEGNDFLRGSFNEPGKTTLIGGPGNDQTYDKGNMKPIN